MSPNDLQGDGKGGGARVFLPSIRRLNPGAAWCSNYEFEDVIRAIDDVDFVELEPAARFPLRQRIARSMAYRAWHPRLTRLNPGVKPVELTRDYDLFAFVCMDVWDLLYLNAIRGWRERCRVKVCFMVEFWAGLAPQLAPFLNLLGDFDHVVECFSGSVSTVARLSGRPCHHVPLAADVLRFTPFPEPPQRVIDVLSMGRRSEPVHEALLGLVERQRIFYLHDTIPGSLVRPARPAQHRAQLANCAKRARFFVTYPAKFGQGDEHQGQSEVGARFFEGAAAGAVLLGQAPTIPAFAEDFPFADAVVETNPDGSDTAAIVAPLLRDEGAALQAASHRNALHALRHHDWGHRWSRLLGIAGLPHRPALDTRLARLAALAEAAASRGPAQRDLRPQLGGLV